MIPFMRWRPMTDAILPRRTIGMLRDGVVYAYPLFLVLALWEGVSRLGLTRPLFLPSVPDVISQFGVMLVSGEIAGPLALSLYRAFAGLLLAVVAGMATGLVM